MLEKNPKPKFNIAYRARGAGVFLLTLIPAGLSAVMVRNVVEHAHKNHISLLEQDHLIANTAGGALFAAAAYFGLRGLIGAFLGRATERPSASAH